MQKKKKNIDFRKSYVIVLIKKFMHLNSLVQIRVATRYVMTLGSCYPFCPSVIGQNIL